MPKVHPGVSNLKEIVEAGGVAVIEAYYGAGWQRSDVLKALGKIYPNAPVASRVAAYDLVKDARALGRKYRGADLGDKVKCTEVNRPQGISRGCTYFVAIPYTEQSTGRKSFITQMVRSPEKLTLSEIISRATSRYFENAATLPGSQGPELDRNYFTDSAYLYSVYNGEF